MEEDSDDGDHDIARDCNVAGPTGSDEDENDIDDDCGVVNDDNDENQ